MYSISILEEQQMRKTVSENIRIPTPADQRKQNMADSVSQQIDAAFRRSHELSYRSRYNYWDAAARFGRYAAEEWSLKNIRNLDNRHVQGYVNHLLDNECTAAYIKGELSAIRHLCHLVNGKRPIHATNDRYNIPDREHMALPGATQQQYETARQLAYEKGGVRLQLAVDFQRHFGERNNESFVFRFHRVADAIRTGVLELGQQDGTKGGRERHIPVETEAQRELLQRAYAYGKEVGKAQSDRLLTGRETGAVHVARAEMGRLYVRNRESLGDVSAHSMRRAYAQDVYDRTPGTDADRMAAVCRVLGHSSDRDDITQVYVANRHAK
jgi:integrase/recombinase XerD